MANPSEPTGNAMNAPKMSLEFPCATVTSASSPMT